MDERRLTAWLITEDVLSSDQVKTVLEEQIRLQRAGQRLDVIGVVRHLDLLPDAEIVRILERTGYRPPEREEGQPAPAGNGDGGRSRRPSDSSNGWGEAAAVMDERRLTAWLITQGILGPDQVKRVLEEQIRLQRQGQKLDVVAVARRLDLLTDAQVADLIERAGYTPAAGPAGTSSGWGDAVASASDVEISDVGPVAAAPAGPAMDERRLTAWLITEGVLSADQVKQSLEEQIRLQRQGTKLDVVAVARRLGVLTDAQVVEVIERTGYAPAAAPGDTPPPAAADASGSVEAVEAVPGPAAAAPAKPGTTSGTRRSSGSKIRTSGTHGRRGRKQSLPVGALAAAVALPFGLLVIMMVVSAGEGVRPGGGSGSADAQLGGGPDLTKETQADKLLKQLRAELARAEVSGLTDHDIRALRGLVADIRDESLDVSRAQAVDRAERQLNDLAGVGAGWGDVSKEEERVGEARTEAAWAELAQSFQDVLWECIDQERSPIQLGAEAVEGVDLGRYLRKLIREKAGQGPDAIASLVGAPDLHPVLGVGGYDALISATERLPAELRQSERWTTWQGLIPRFQELRERAAAYTRALIQAELATEMGQVAAARDAFAKSKYGETDRWFKAALAYLSRPEVEAAIRSRADGGAGAGPVARRGRLPVPPSRGDGEEGGVEEGSQVALTGDWKERFLYLERELRTASESAIPRIARDLGEVLDETLGLSKDAFERCREIVDFYDAHDRVFRDQAPLKEKLRLHHEVYFEAAFRLASGPYTFRALDKWCDDHGYSAWRARLKPFLRLVAAAESRQAREREAVRRQRADIREKVAVFARERVDGVAEGLSNVLSWMRRRGYAPDEVKAELDDLIARAVQRSGNPVQGARLREELKAVSHKAAEADLARLRADYDKQLQQLIDEAVDDSLKAVERCLGAGEFGVAFDLFGYVLLLDPQNDRAHKGLGHIKVDGTWLRRFEAERLKEGYAWDQELGWVLAAERARYDEGEYYDLQTKSWTTVAEASRRHADPNDPWVIRTEHFELRSTADLPKTIQIANRLEAFYLAMFRQYDLYFVNKGGAKLIFGVAPSQKPLVVNFYRDEAQFRAHANPPTGWAAGFYSGGQHASFFYDMGNGYSGVTVLQHEVTHQVLGETAGSGGGAPAWLAEGAAVYLEDAFFRDGALSLGDLKDHSRVVAYKRGAPGGQEHSFSDMLKFVTSADWDSGDISKNYRGAGAVVYFLCHFDEGRYRGDFVEFLRDSYYGKRPTVEDYFGLPEEVLDALMKRFYDPDAQLELEGGGSGADLAVAKEAFEASCKTREPNLDQLTEAYGMLRDALGGAEEKEADKARKSAARALVSMRRKLVKDVERAAKDASSGDKLRARYQELLRLRQEALAIINDTSRYPDENHGAAGQPLVDEKVNALKAFWSATPPELEEPEVVRAVEVLTTTEPWLDELEVSDRSRGESMDDLRDFIRKRTHVGLLPVTDEDRKRFERDEKVRDYNASRTDLPEDIREQVRILNDYRDMLGLHALALETRLHHAARKHSEWMEQTGQFDHNQPNAGRRTPQERAGQEGYTAPVGENIAFGYHSAQAVHDGWYNSSGHHRNMVSKGWHEIGVGRAGVYWTQNFGGGKPPFLGN